MLNITHFRLREPAIYSPNQAVRQGQSPLYKPSQSPPRFQDTRADMQWIGSMPVNATATNASRVSSTGQSFTERLLNALSPLRP